MLSIRKEKYDSWEIGWYRLLFHVNSLLLFQNLKKNILRTTLITLSKFNWALAHDNYSWMFLPFSRITSSSLIWLHICKTLIPFSVVLYLCDPSSYSINPFCISSPRYSLICEKVKKALYMILVLDAPPLAASNINPIISDLLLYFIGSCVFSYSLYMLVHHLFFKLCLFLYQKVTVNLLTTTRWFVTRLWDVSQGLVHLFLSCENRTSRIGSCLLPYLPHPLGSTGKGIVFLKILCTMLPMAIES